MLHLHDPVHISMLLFWICANNVRLAYWFAKLKIIRCITNQCSLLSQKLYRMSRPISTSVENWIGKLNNKLSILSSHFTKPLNLIRTVLLQLYTEKICVKCECQTLYYYKRVSEAKSFINKQTIKKSEPSQKYSYFGPFFSTAMILITCYTN